MAHAVIPALRCLAVGAGLSAQPWPGTGTAERYDFTSEAQADIFRQTPPAMLLRPIALLRRLGA